MHPVAEQVRTGRDFIDPDHAALFAARAGDVGLCTIVGIDGSFSRRLGAQLAVLPDGTFVGSLSDGCLEQQLASDLADLSEPVVKRYGRGSDTIDFRLPCGGGLDILLDPKPDRQACETAVRSLTRREPAALPFPAVSPLAQRRYIPALEITVFGEGPEPEAFAQIARVAGIAVRTVGKDALSLGQMPDLPPPDRWTAALLLFHDHEWELPVLRHALAGDAFYIGAQGGENARIARTHALLGSGVSEEDIRRIQSPVGLIDACRDPHTLAVSALAEIMAAYERLRPRA